MAPSQRRQTGRPQRWQLREGWRRSPDSESPHSSARMKPATQGHQGAGTPFNSNRWSAARTARRRRHRRRVSATSLAGGTGTSTR